MSQSNTQPYIPSVKSLIIGFVLALSLTLISFSAVHFEWLSGTQLIVALLALAAIQTSVQLWFFLHLKHESKPRWNTVFLFNFIGIILLIVIASIWIMNSLHYRMMGPEQMEQYMMEQKDKGF